MLRRPKPPQSAGEAFWTDEYRWIEVNRTNNFALEKQQRLAVNFGAATEEWVDVIDGFSGERNYRVKRIS